MPKTIQSLPRWMAARKPKHGAACNHCGLCCFSQKCDLGKALFGNAPGPCPALKWDSEVRSHCDVVNNPQSYTNADVETAREAAKLLLYAGHGCTMRINGEMNVDFNNKLASLDVSRRDELDEAAELWGVKPPNTF